MAIPIGRTASQLSGATRWLLTGVIALGMLTWWSPGYFAWGGMVASVGVILAFWLCWRTIAADRTVPGNPIYLALLGPGAVMMFHLARTGLGAAEPGYLALGGSVNTSVIFHLLLLGGVVMLVGSLLSGTSKQMLIVSICGAAMMIGSAAAMMWGKGGPIRDPLALLGFGGVAVWITPFCEDEAMWRRVSGYQPRWIHLLRIIRVGVAVFAAIVLAAVSPRGAAIAGGLIFGLLILAGVIFTQSRKSVLVAASVLGAIGAAAVVITRPGWEMFAIFKNVPVGPFGVGEEAFSEVSASDAGVVVLGAMVGWVGLLWFLGVMAACLVWLLSFARGKGTACVLRAVLWTAATILATGAFLSVGGLFIPSVTMALGFVWGLAPAMCGRSDRARPGIILVAVLAGLMLLLGVVRDPGLAGSAARAFGVTDTFLHGAAGFFLAMSLAWVMGARRLWAGVLGIFLAAAAGGAGELLQGALSRRGVEWSDWRAHIIGSLAVIVPYLLAMGSRWCESPDARVRPAGVQQSGGLDLSRAPDLWEEHRC